MKINIIHNISKVLSLRAIALFVIAVYLSGCGGDQEKKPINELKQDTIAENNSTIHLKNKKLTYIQAYDRALALWQTPFEEKDIKTDFGSAHVIICGPANGESLVLLHGMNASSTMWYPNIKVLSEYYRVYAIDFLLEPSKSVEQGNACRSTHQIVNWYFDIFDQLHLKKFSLLGASRGGWLAVNIALRAKSRINTIALLSPAQTLVWIRPGPKIISNITYSISPKRKRLRSVLETMTYNVDNISQVYIDQYYIATQKATINKCFLEMTPFSDKELRSLTMPVLVLIGDNDIINNEKSLEKAKKLFPNVETEKIKNAGHFLSMDQPEVVNKRVLNFLVQNRNLSAKK